MSEDDGYTGHIDPLDLAEERVIGVIRAEVGPLTVHQEIAIKTALEVMAREVEWRADRRSGQFW